MIRSLTSFLAASALLLAGALGLPGCFTNRERSGEALYAQHCANCHGPEGGGLANLMPPLAGADYLRTQRAQLPCLVRQGMRGPLTVNGRTYNGVMPAFDAQKLSDADVANVLNYVRTAWGNHEPEVITPEDVANRNCP